MFEYIFSNSCFRLCFCFVFLLPTLSFADSTNNDPSFFERNKEGWFWYEVLPILPKEEEPKKEEPKDSAVPPKNNEFVRVPLEDLRKVPAADFRVLIEKARDEALTKLDFDSTYYYMEVQKEMFSRTAIFAALWRQILWSNPSLDTTVKNPVSTMGNKIAQEVDVEDLRATLKEAAEMSGLFYFFTSTCPYCAAESKILKGFAEQYGFRVFSVTLDGKCSAEFPDCSMDNGMSKKLNISNVPTIYMAIPPDSLQLVSSGFLVTPELETRISFYWKAIKENRIGPGVKPNPAVFNQPPANRQTGEPAAPILYK